MSDDENDINKEFQSLPTYDDQRLFLLNVLRKGNLGKIEYIDNIPEELQKDLLDHCAIVYGNMFVILYIKNVSNSIKKYMIDNSFGDFLTLIDMINGAGGFPNNWSIGDEEILLYAVRIEPKILKTDRIKTCIIKHYNCTFSENTQIELIKADPSIVGLLGKHNLSNNAISTFFYQMYFTGRYSNVDLKNINGFSEDFKREVVINYPYMFVFINEPSEKICFDAVYEDPYLIRWMDNPSENVQMTAISINANQCFHFIQNPTDKVIIEAINTSTTNIYFVKNPSYDVQRYVIDHYPFYFGYIDKPYEELQLEILEKYWTDFYHIIMDNFSPHSEWFNKEVNRLKLQHGVPY